MEELAHSFAGVELDDHDSEVRDYHYRAEGFVYNLTTVIVL